MFFSRRKTHRSAVRHRRCRTLAIEVLEDRMLLSLGDLLHTFTNPSPGALDLFGFEVAISGNYAVLSAVLDDTGATDAGQAYLFDATTGNLLRTFINPSPGSGDRFGSDAAISGNLVLIGADHAFGSGQGEAYLFDAVTGNLLRTFTNPTPASFDAVFGAINRFLGEADG
jgi:hypothetical protein